MRESPAKYIAQRILQDSHDDTCFIVEPNLKEHKVFKLTEIDVAVEKADIIVFLVAHNEFKKNQLIENKVVLDFCGVFPHQ